MSERTIEVPIDNVIWREDLYPRIEPNAQKIQEYAENVELLPPIEISQDNIIIDGYHRWRAYQTAKEDTIEVTITPVESEEELLMLAIKRNAKHGLQLSSDAKKRYVLRWWDRMPVEEICVTLAISESVFYDWTRNKSQAKRKSSSTRDREPLVAV